MNITVQGILLSPLNEPLINSAIRFTALTTTGESPEQSDAEFYTLDDGSYNFTLMYGYYQVEINYEDEYHLLGNVIAEAETPSPITIQELLDYTTAVTPPVIVPETPNWVDLHDDLRTDLNTTERVKIDQLSDLNTYTNETKRLIQNDVISAEMAEESVMTNVGTARLDDQTNVYQDGNNHQSIQKTTGATTANGSFDIQTELYEASNGSVDIYSQLALNAPVGSYTLDTTLDGTTVGKVEVFTNNIGTYNNSTTILGDTFSHGLTYTATEGNNTVTTSRTELLQTSYTDGIGNDLDEPKVEIASITSLDRVGAVTHDVDIVHKQEARVDAADQTQASQELSLSGSGKVMGIFQYLDNITQTQIIKADNTSVVGSNDVTLVEMDAINNEVTIHGRLIVTNPEDFAGAPGASKYFEYEYSEDNGVTDAWHAGFDQGLDLWRRQREVTDPNDGSPLTYGPWSDGFLLNAVDGSPGDSLWIEYAYGAGTDTVPPSLLDPSWTETMQDGDIWRRERIVTNGVPANWSTPARIKGLNGADPEVVLVEYQYAIDGLSASPIWHYNFETGDHFRRERILYFATPADLAAYVPISNDTSYNQSPWNNVAQIVPINGIDYGTKQTTVYIYQRHNSEVTPPADPSGDLTWDFDNLTLTPAGNLNGWSTTIPTGTLPLWIGVAVATATGATDTMAAAEWDYALWTKNGTNGTNGLTPVLVNLYCVTAAGVTPTKTFSSVTHTISSGANSINGSNTYGWQDSVPSNVASGGQVWIITDIQLAAAGTTYTYHYPHNFSAPAVLSRNGIDGVGTPGQHGSGSYVIETTASKATVQGYSTSTRNSHFNSAAGRAAQDKDVLSYINDTAAEASRFRLDYIYNGSSWSGFISVVDGNQIVHGTVAAHHVVAGTFTGDEFNAAFEVTAGSGNSIAAMSGSNATYRLWAGNTNPASAPFSVDKDGKLKATNADITGAITATSGTFSGDLSGAGGTFSGDISGASGSFSGSLNAATGSFSGNLQAGSINGIRFKIGTFRSTTDGDQTISLSTTEGRVYTTSGTYSQVGNTTPGFSALMGVTISLMTPGQSSVGDAHIPKILNSGSFIFNRDDLFAGNIVFSYIAFGY